MRCFAPCFPIRLYERPSKVSVFMKLKTVGWEREKERRTSCLTVLCSRASLRCFAPSSPIRLLQRSSEVSVCMKSKTVGWEREKERRTSFVLPCYAVERHSDVLLLDLRFDCPRGQVKWVSVWSRKQLDEKEKKKEFFCFTALCRIAWLRYFAPWSPIWLYLRWSEVSVYMKSKTVGWETEKGRRNFFVLPCYAVNHYSDILLLQLRFDCPRG
jgi:hypothetical protein